MTAMATKRDDEIGTGALPRWSATVYWFLVVEVMLVLTSAPGLVLLQLLERDASNVPLVALACVPFAPSVAAALFAWRVFARDRDLSPARYFWRGYRLDVLDVLRWWVPTLAVLAVIGINLAHLGAAGLPSALGVALGAVVLLLVIWSGHALALSALFSFRTRDVARLGAYFLAAKPLVSLGIASVLVLTVAAAFVTDWLLVLLAAPLTYLYARTVVPVVTAAEAQFTA
ncbi:glycosyl transferase [Cellulomonas fengjieae]|uniref:glycosyl transferase n=1 Tax=Cellulomonas fengjieae TaxID=2819978 RepID=UPI001AAE2ECF|nr:glycosyl transferase [Cellulomonas fengjieae]MBO3102014.1 glycosyl transferase [Cellulomonas fengjieae]